MNFKYDESKQEINYIPNTSFVDQIYQISNSLYEFGPFRYSNILIGPYKFGIVPLTHDDHIDKDTRLRVYIMKLIGGKYVDVTFTELNGVDKVICEFNGVDALDAFFGFVLQFTIN